MSENRQLIKKLTEVMAAVERIPKNGINQFHKYKYATESDVSDAIRKELASRNVMMIPDVVEQTTREHVNNKGNREYIATIKMAFTFQDGDTGESITFHSVGEGQDAGDKAVYKAITGATKYALMKAFIIPTGDDPEADSKVDERNAGNSTKPDNQEKNHKLTEKQVNRLFAIAKNAGVDVADVKKAMLKDYQVTNAEDLSKQQYDELCARLEKAGA